MYKEIAEELTRRGFTVTPLGCRRKYNKLFDRYKKVKDNNALTGIVYIITLFKLELGNL